MGAKALQDLSTGGRQEWALIGFYGILGAEASQWEPAAIDQTTPIEPHIGREDYHLTEDLADQAIKWIHQQKASAPEKPFFCLFRLQQFMPPHHAPEEWIENSQEISMSAGMS